MNPFSSVDDFEALRTAALADAEVYGRFVRRLRGAKQASTTEGKLELPGRVERMIDLSVATGPAVLLVGPPGTGKTQALREAMERIDSDPEAYGFDAAGVDANWVTPEEEWTFETLVLGETVVDGALVSTEGVLLESLREGKWLVLDEANRADMDRIFGGVLTWLSGRRVRVGDLKIAGSSSRPVFLDWASTERSYRDEDAQTGEIVYYAGTDWRMLGTYNAVDAQRVFRMGQALTRRFLHVPIPPIGEASFQRLLGSRLLESELGRWVSRSVSALYAAHLSTTDAQVGPALFLNIPRYLIAAAGNVESELDAPPGPSVGEVSSDSLPVLPDVLLDELLGEAYLVSVGSFVAKFDSELLEALGAEVVARGALSQATWAWIIGELQWMRA